MLFASAFVVAGAEKRTLQRISAQAPTIKRWGGWILTAVGLWLITLAVFADFFADVFPV